MKTILITLLLCFNLFAQSEVILLFGSVTTLADATPPTPPSDYLAIGGSSATQYVTTWTDPAAGDLDSLRWYEGSSSDTTAMSWITSIAAGVGTYTRTGRSASTTYWSAVKAIDTSGNVSWFSNRDSATTISGSSAEPSYANPCGIGDRTDSITVTSDYIDGGADNLLVDGDETSDVIYFTVGLTAGHYVRFDFGAGISKVIDEAIWIQSETNAQGTWKWQGLNNASDWTDIGSSFTLAGTDLSTTLTELNGNTTGYRYYQLLGVSGSTSNSPYLNEIRFKIDDN